MEEEEISAGDGGIFASSSENSPDFPVPEFDAHELVKSAQQQTKKGKRTTVCIADSDGNPLVAKAEYDESGQLGLLENYRRPTQAEWNKLQTRAQIVKQGQIGDAQTPAASTGSGIPKFVKIGAIVLGVAAVGVGGVYLYKKSRNSNPSEPPGEWDGRGLDDDDDDDDFDGDED